MGVYSTSGDEPRERWDVAMAESISYPHIEKVPGEPARLQRLPRVRVAQIVMDFLAHAWSAEKICEEYPHLRPAEVHAAMAYYYDHRPEIDAEIAEEMRLVEEAMAQPPSPLALRLRGLVRPSPVE